LSLSCWFLFIMIGWKICGKFQLLVSARCGTGSVLYIYMYLIDFGSIAVCLSSCTSYVLSIAACGVIGCLCCFRFFSFISNLTNWDFIEH
jgi:hypothetical protein